MGPGRADISCWPEAANTPHVAVKKSTFFGEGLEFLDGFPEIQGLSFAISYFLVFEMEVLSFYLGVSYIYICGFLFLQFLQLIHDH